MRSIAVLFYAESVIAATIADNSKNDTTEYAQIAKRDMTEL